MPTAKIHVVNRTIYNRDGSIASSIALAVYYGVANAEDRRMREASAMANAANAIVRDKEKASEVWLDGRLWMLFHIEEFFPEDFPDSV